MTLPVTLFIIYQLGVGITFSKMNLVISLLDLAEYIVSCFKEFYILDMKSKTEANDSYGSLEFGDLPLIEVAARIVLAPELADFGIGKISKLTEALKNKFPIVEDVSSLEMTGPMPKLPKVVPGVLMGVNLVAMPQDVRVTVQRNMIKWSWTRALEENTKKLPEYPRYNRVRDELLLVTEWVRNIFSKNVLPVNIVNMVYTNFVATKAKTISETSGRYLARSINPAIMEDSSAVHEISLNWRTSNGLDRRVQFAAGHSSYGPDQVEGYVLSTSVGGFMGSKENPIKLLDEVHLDLQGFFLTVISDQAKKEWEYVERS
jgi:uncharacterized protein (TIGR04255 family)